ncbi:uncharacterized protein LOC143207071 [Lasioglossum baleicum]|uniref:uncharacterized protein LOC143207071 n=1 Tax=Lasioglossum baleicum TaxID=434251 RepID=UPI003FCD3D4D
MGRVTESGCSSTKGQRKNNVREEQRVRAKKKRRKKDLIDLHCGLRKPGKGKETKTDGKLVKPRNSKKTSNRILPRLTGIYRNGAIGKEIRRAQPQVLLGESNNARLEGNVLKLLHGYDTNAQTIVINDDREQPNDLLLDPAAKNILHPTPPSVHSVSPILGKVVGTKRRIRGEQEGHVGPSKCPDLFSLVADKRKVVHTPSPQDSAIRQYEELSATICTEFEGLNLPNELTADRLSSVKKKLRGAYAASYHSQFLKDMIKRGQILNECVTPSCLGTNPVIPEAVYSTSGYGESPDLIAATVVTKDPHDVYKKPMKQVDSQANQYSIVPSNAIHREKRKEVPSPNLLFGVSLLGQRRIDKVESEHHARSGDSYFFGRVPDDAPLEGCREKSLDNEVVARIDKSDTQSDRKALLFSRSVTEMLREPTNKKHLVKRKNQRTQTTNSLNNRIKRHQAKGNAKATHQMNAKNLKHVPAILRRCNKISLFDSPTEKTIEKPNPNVSFTPLHFELENSREAVCSSDTSILNVQTCVVASPSLRKDLGKNSEWDPEPSGVNNVFQKRIRKIPMIQKTLIFTKKDSRNKCPHLNDLVAERPVDSNICLVRQEAPQQQEKCGDFQRAASNCYQSFYCSDNSVDSNYCSQELKEVSVPQVRPLQVQQEPVACEELFVGKLQHPGKNHTVCFVAVDRGKELNGVQDYGKVLPEKVYRQDNAANVGILKGVQNLNILPMEDQRAKCATQYMADTVVLEEQPVKYLAFDDDSEAQRIPIYVQSKQRPQFTSVDNPDANLKVNYRLVSCPPEPTQKILLLPSHEQNKVVYVKEKSMNRPAVTYERVDQPRKMFYYRPRSQSDLQCEQNSNICEVRVSKQNLVEIVEDAEYKNISGLQHAELGTNMRKSYSNWEEVHHRPSHEHTIVKDACAKTVYFKQ